VERMGVLPNARASRDGIYFFSSFLNRIKRNLKNR